MIVGYVIKARCCREKTFYKKLINIIADKSKRDALNSPSSKSRKCSVISPWLGFFGDYASEHAQNQSPAFNMGSGGIVLACDYLRLKQIQPIGAGLSYAHTHLHKKNGFGSANVDQGAILLLGVWVLRKRRPTVQLWAKGTLVFNASQ